MEESEGSIEYRAKRKIIDAKLKARPGLTSFYLLIVLKLINFNVLSNNLIQNSVTVSLGLQKIIVRPST